MKVVSQPHRDILKVLGQQSFSGADEYRYCIYSIPYAVPEGVLLYNNLTKHMILLEKDEYSEDIASLNADVVKYLVQYWFLLPRDIDDYSLFWSFRQSYPYVMRRSTYGKISLCTVFPTTGCNARCYYCYEAGIKPKTMSDKVANDIVEWLVPRAATNLTMKWFGGEPLCNEKAIDIICNGLKEKNMSFRSVMISNGLLLDASKIEKYKSVWDLYKVQVTIDGTKDEYIKAKNFKSFSEDPYETVLSNISSLVASGIRVDIRSHLTGSNMEDIYALTDELKVRFNGNRLVTLYIHPLFENTGDVATTTEKSREAVQQQFYEITKYIDEAGLGINYHILSYKHCHCMADNGRSVCITPDGDLTLCEHHCEDEIYGSIYNKTYDKETLLSWLESGSEYIGCHKCPYRPACQRLKKCPVDYICSAGFISYQQYLTQQQMLGTYKDFKKRQEEIV